MELAKMTVEAYIDQLGSNAPAPGGGSASALCGAQGAALVTMVAELTVGKAKYAEFEELCRRAIEEGSKLRKDLVADIDKDTQAFNASLSEEQENKVLEQLKSEGCNVVDVPDKSAWVEAVQDVISANTSGYEELYQQIVDMK